MAFKNILICVFMCVFLNLSNGQVQVVNRKIHMQIGTTANCPDVANFMLQLGPVYQKYKRFLDIQFVPWGRARREANGELTCQFGEKGCWANRLHRCVIDILKDNTDSIVKFMECEFSDARPGFSGSYYCASEVDVRLVEVDNCMLTGGDALEAAAEAASVEPIRIINFVPFIVFNGEISQEISTQARQRLESVICFALAEDFTTGVNHCKI